MAEYRGRPKDIIKPIREQWVQEWYEYPSKPELGRKYIWHCDNNKTKSGLFKVEIIYPKGVKCSNPIIDKNQAYGKMPVVMVFKTSNRSNAKIKMKIWKTTNIDYINSLSKIPGVPKKAIILHTSIGVSFIEKYKLEYNL